MVLQKALWTHLINKVVLCVYLLFTKIQSYVDLYDYVSHLNTHYLFTSVNYDNYIPIVGKNNVETVA